MSEGLTVTHCSGCGEQLAEENRALRAALEKCMEALGWPETERRLKVADPDYADLVKALGERIGYGVVMREASRLWYEKVGGGAFAVGHCLAFVKDADKAAREALARRTEGA